MPNNGFKKSKYTYSILDEGLGRGVRVRGRE